MFSRRTLLLGGGLAMAAASCGRRSALERVSLRLQWYPQTQFAGYLVAREKGYYRDAGIDIDIRSAGPDLRPTTTVAAGSDDFGIGVSNQVISARANSAPLVIVAQVFRDSANRYVLKAANRIANLTELRGKRVGLWLGGDEAEFVAMLASANMRPTDVQIVPQEFSVAPFLQDQFVLSQVTTYNELLQLQDAGLTGSALQVLAPGAYDCAIPSDMIFTRDQLVQENPDLVRRFVAASMRGWQRAFEAPAEAVSIAVAANSELDAGQQLRQLEQVQQLVTADGDGPIGSMNRSMYETASRVLRVSGQLDREIDVSTVFSTVAFQA